MSFKKWELSALVCHKLRSLWGPKYRKHRGRWWWANSETFIQAKNQNTKWSIKYKRKTESWSKIGSDNYTGWTETYKWTSQGTWHRRKKKTHKLQKEFRIENKTKHTTRITTRNNIIITQCWDCIINNKRETINSKHKVDWPRAMTYSWINVSKLWIQFYGWTVFICSFCFWVNWPFNEQRGQISLVAILKNYLWHSRQTPNCDYMPFNV